MYHHRQCHRCFSSWCGYVLHNGMGQCDLWHRDWSGRHHRSPVTHSNWKGSEVRMKSAIYQGRKEIEIRDVPIPTIGESDVLIQNIYSSICGTDIAVYQHGPNTGHRITVGGEFGHETVSRIVDIGENVTDFHIGQRVYPYPLYAKNDANRAGAIGGFSQYILIPNARLSHSLYVVPDQITDKMACLIEPFTVGCRAARRAQPRSGEKAAVFGCGTIGIAAAISLKWFGVKQVMLCDPSDFRLEIAKSLGFAVCNVQRQDFQTEAVKFFKTADSLSGKVADIDMVIDAAGAESVLDEFMEHGKFGSRFVSVAVNRAMRSLDLLHMTYAQQSIIGSGGYMPEDVLEVMKIMKSGKWNIEHIITHEFSLDELQMAIETAGDTACALNVVIQF